MEKKKATQKSIKENNIGLMLKKIRDEGSISRIKLSKTTKLAKSSISDIVSYLIKKGLVSESEKAESKIGKKPILLKFNNDSFYILAIDIGQDNLMVALANSVGRIVQRVETINYPKKNRAEILDSIFFNIDKVLINSKSVQDKIKILSVGTHGVVDPRTNIITKAPYLKDWSGVNLVKILGDKYKKKVSINNSVNLGAIGEQWKNYPAIKNLIYIDIDHGIGAGIIIDSQIITGYDGTAGEISYLPILRKGDFEKLKNNKLELGIFENQLDIKGITRTVKKSLLKNKNIDLINNKKIDRINFDDICIDYINSSNGPIKEIIDNEIIKVLAIGISAIISIVASKLIIINGDILKFGEEFFRKLEKNVHAITPFKRNIVLSKLKKDAHIYGAVRNGIDYLNNLLYNDFYSLID